MIRDAYRHFREETLYDGSWKVDVTLPKKQKDLRAEDTDGQPQAYFTVAGNGDTKHTIPVDDNDSPTRRSSGTGLNSPKYGRRPFGTTPKMLQDSAALSV